MPTCKSLERRPQPQAATGTKYVVFTGSRAAMQRILSDAPGPGQAQAATTVCLAKILCQRGSIIDVRWVPGHHGVEGNGKADQHARGAAEGRDTPTTGRERVGLTVLKKQRTEKGTPVVEGRHYQTQPVQENLQVPCGGYQATSQVRPRSGIKGTSGPLLPVSLRPRFDGPPPQGKSRKD